MHVRKFLAGISLIAALALTACGGGEGGNTGGGAAAAPLAVAADPTGALAFQQKTLSAAANQAFSVTFNNPAALQHNWVLVQPGQEQAVADAAGAKGGDATGVAGVIAAGKVLNPNTNETINVPATAAGTYTYICTVPGHYASGMVGQLTIQ
jgi:uncharacterized cupredoxin-like copper-binding protein